MCDFPALLNQISDNLKVIASGSYPDAVARATKVLGDALAAGNKVLVFGNGGSAADAEHIAGELVGRFKRERRPVPVIALGTNHAYLTAWSNDVDYEDVFARELEALGRPGDVAWGISTSGNSKNVVAALRRAKAIGMKTIALTGEGGGAAAILCDVLMAAPVRETARVQEIHLVTYHAICAAIEQAIP